MNKKFYNELLNLQNGQCAICGSNRPLYIEHIVPKSDEFNDVRNMILVCAKCNSINSNKVFKGFELTDLIFNILNKDNRFEDVKREIDVSTGVDIIAIENIAEKRKIAISIKPFSNFTDVRIDDIILQINESVADKDIKQIFLFPGYISTSDNIKFALNNIEVWDITKLSNLFNENISATDNLKFFKLYGASILNDEKKLIEDLKKISPGRAEWSKYQKHVRKILEYLFSEKLSSPILESNDEFKINRRDFILRNYSNIDFWKYLRERYFADFIVVDAKNYTEAVTKKEILQIANYLKIHGTGLFAIIIARNGEKKSSYLTRREKWVLENKLIIILSDFDIEKMILAKASSNDPEEIIKQSIEDFRLKI